MRTFDIRAYQREWLSKRRKEWFSANGPCALCGSSEKLELDHRDTSSKTSHKIWSWAKARREAELAKCRVLCHKCHIDRHANERIRHGVGRYKNGCRCEVCRQAKSRQRSKEKDAQLERQFQASVSTVNYVPTNAALAVRQYKMRERQAR